MSSDGGISEDLSVIRWRDISGTKVSPDGGISEGPKCHQMEGYLKDLTVIRWRDI